MTRAVSFCAAHQRWEFIPADLDHATDPHQLGPAPAPAPLGSIVMEPTRPTLEVEAHHLLEAPDSAALAHELSADCWCGPEVQIVHRLAAPAPAPSTIPDHQVVSLDELRKRGDL